MKVLYIFSSYSNHCPYFQQWLSELIKPKYFQQEIGMVFRLEGSVSNLPQFEHITYFPFKESKSQYAIFQAILNRISIYKLTTRLQTFDSDLIHLHGCYSTLMAKITFSLRGKLIFNVWGNDFNTLYFKSKKYERIFLRLFTRSKFILANWHLMAEAIAREIPHLKNKIITIPWGIEIGFYSLVKSIDEQPLKSKLGIEHKTLVVSSMKGAVPNSNLDTMVRSIAHLNDFPNLKFILHAAVGEERYLTQLQNLVNSLQLQDKVIFSRTKLSENDYVALMKITDIALILPSKDQFTRTIFEAIVANCNLILSDIPPYRDLPDLFGSEIPLINPRSDLELSENIRSLILKLNHNNKSDKMMNVLKDKFQFELQIDKIFSLYELALRQ